MLRQVRSNEHFKVPTALELFETIKNYKTEWKQKTPKQKWCILYAIGRISFTACQYSIFRDINVVHWFAFFIIGYQSIIFLLSLYSIYIFNTEGAIEKALPSTCMPCIFIGVSKQHKIDAL